MIRRPALAFIFALVVVDVIAMGIVIPVLPKLVEAFEGGDTARAAEVYGVFGTAWALMQFVFMPVLGALSDRFGRRPVILLSCFGLGLDYFLRGYWRDLSGVVSSYLQDSSPGDIERALGLGPGDLVDHWPTRSPADDLD